MAISGLSGNEKVGMNSGHNSTQAHSGFGMSTTTTIMEGAGDDAAPVNANALYQADSFSLFLLGKGTAARHQRVLSIILFLCFVLLAGMVS